VTAGQRLGRGLFVTGTDTGVGKTEVACGLLRAWRASGRDVAAMKPAQSGVEPGTPSDAELLAAAAGTGDPADLVCPYSFAAPLAPAVAARLAGVEIDLARILAAARALASGHDALLVEGAGGLLVPLTARETYADLAVALGYPVLVVARTGLGTVNHAALTVEALRSRGLTVVGVVLNAATAARDPSEAYNAAEIERLSGAPVLGAISHCDAIDRDRRIAEIAPRVQF
jgi:dethiobiotin synthetase